MITTVADVQGTWDLAQLSCARKELTFNAKIGDDKIRNGLLKGVMTIEPSGRGSFEFHGEFRVMLIPFSCQYSGAFEIQIEKDRVVLRKVVGQDTSPSCPLPIFPYGDGDTFAVDLKPDGQTLLSKPQPDATGSKESSVRISKVNKAYCGSAEKGELQYHFVRRK